MLQKVNFGSLPSVSKLQTSLQKQCTSKTGFENGLILAGYVFKMFTSENI